MYIPHLSALLVLLAVSTAFAEQDGGYDQLPLEQIEWHQQMISEEFADVIDPQVMSRSSQSEILNSYKHLDPKKWVPSNLLKEAVLYFDLNKSKFKNKNYISVVDFSPRSNNYRFFLIDLKTGTVERYRTTHGLGSDKNDDGYAEIFGNEIGSGKSSLGYVRTAEVYYGDFGRSLRLDGLSSSNSNIRARAVVFHGWDGVKEANVVQKLSRGCITMDWNFKDTVLDKIKHGSFMHVGLSK